ncbi:MAG: septum formation initiator family protein [Lachnospiraceae bacterium]|nr:septum formation initiator family protein [Lachnospiraceae bacterium]
MANGYAYGSTAERRRERENGPHIHPIREERRRNSKRVRYNIYNILTIFASVVVVIMVVFGYIRLQTDVTKDRETLAKLKTQYEELKRSNDLYKDRIDSGIDLGEVARVAREDLGMKIAGEGQIIMYEGCIDDYVKQYNDIR